MDWLTILILCFVLYFMLKRADENKQRQRELQEIKDQRAALDIKLQVLMGALDRLRSGRF